MTQQPIEPQQTIDIIRKQHKALLSQIEGPKEVDIEQVRIFLRALEQAGATVDDAEDRSWLHELIRYWSSFIGDKTGEFPVTQLQPFTRSRADGGAKNVTGNLKAYFSRQGSIRGKLFGRRFNILIIAIVAMIIIGASAVSILRIQKAGKPTLTPTPAIPNATRLNCSSISTTTSSASISPWICSSPISSDPKHKDKLFMTVADRWTIIEGDVYYLDPNQSKNYVLVKTAVDPSGAASDVGSLLVVLGTTTIKAPNGGSFALYLGNATHEQIGLALIQHQQDLIKSGCKNKCKKVSTVIICHSVKIFGGEITTFESLVKELQGC